MRSDTQIKKQIPTFKKWKKKNALRLCSKQGARFSSYGYSSMASLTHKSPTIHQIYYLPAIPPETTNFITSALSALRGAICSFGTIMRFPAKLYDWGRYTATLSDNPRLFRLSLVRNPMAFTLPSRDNITVTGLLKPFLSPTNAFMRSFIDV